MQNTLPDLMQLSDSLAFSAPYPVEKYRDTQHVPVVLDCRAMDEFVSTKRPTDCKERHYTLKEISKLWAISYRTALRMFQDEPGVLKWGSEETLHKRGYKSLRVPESVLMRVHRELSTR